MKNNVLSVLVGLITTGLCVVNVAQTSLVTNGNFTEWENGSPQGWSVEIGANNGSDQPISSLEKGAGPSLRVTGNAQTMAWRSISQTIPIDGGKTYRLRYSAKVQGLVREGRQFDNCYFGLMQKHERGQTLQKNIEVLQAEQWQEISLVFRTHRMASSVQLLIFLSKTGSLSVRDVSLELLRPQQSFQILVDEMDRHYSYFNHKQIDWKELTDKYRSRATDASPDEFTEVVGEMLAELKDVHIWLEQRRRRTSKYVSRYNANYQFSLVDESLRDKKDFGDLGMTGITKEGFGYIRITSFGVQTEETVQAMIDDIRGRLFETKGLIVDVRRNPGGSEFFAQRIGGLFTDKKRVYARNKIRIDESHDSFYETSPRTLAPAKSSYTNPMVCLIGPGAVSSAEGFAMMMKALPHVTLIGQATRGASGNPKPVQLPNGVDVWFSRWVSLLPDGTVIEDVGVAPDETVEHGEGDATYSRAIELLEKSAK